MKEATQKNLLDAFAGESQAHMKYKIFAELAEKENLPEIARLFRAASYSEQIHATNHLRALGIGKTLANLEGAFAGETYEIDTMYPEFIDTAVEDEEKRAKRSMEDALAAEKIHAELYARAREALGAGNDVTLPKTWVCPVCGYTMEGEEAPDACPICKALKKLFKEF